MCEYCKNFNKKASELGLGDIFIVDNAKYTSVGDGYAYSIPMNYCPNCGQELATIEGLCNQEMLEDIKKQLAEYDKSWPKVDELKFVKDIADKYHIESRNVVKIVQYIRRHSK